MVYLNRKAILEQSELLTADVEVPEWGDGAKVLVRELTAYEQMNIGVSAVDDDGNVDNSQVADLYAAVVSMGLLDEKKRPQFTINQVKMLPSRYADVIARIANKILELSDMLAGEDAENPTSPQSDASNSA